MKPEREPRVAFSPQAGRRWRQPDEGPKSRRNLLEYRNERRRPFDNVSRYFGAVRAVDRVNLEIAEGEFFAMLGPSGSGKPPA